MDHRYEILSPHFNGEGETWKLEKHLQRFEHQMKSCRWPRVLLYRLDAQHQAPKEWTAGQPCQVSALVLQKYGKTVSRNDTQ
jgi:hypothetical protein